MRCAETYREVLDSHQGDLRRTTEGFYDTALNEGYCPNSVLLETIFEIELVALLRWIALDR